MKYSTGPKIDIILSDVELIKILSWCPIAVDTDHGERMYRDSIILHMLASTGIRRNELRTLDKCSVQSFGDRSWILIDGKGSRTRSVPLSNTLVARIQIYFKFRRDQQSESFLTPTRYSHRDRLSNIALGRVSLKRSHQIIGWAVNPHRFRHSIATYWIRNGVNIRTVQALLGHSNLVSTTRYLHTTADELVQAVDLLHESARVFSPGLFTKPSHKLFQSGK